MLAPEIDIYIRYSKQYPLIEDPVCLAKLAAIFELLCELEIQGEDEMRSIWIEADRGSIEDFGSFKEYRKEGQVNTRKEFEELWQYYYPDQLKWYDLRVIRFDNQLYFHFDFELTWSTTDRNKAMRDIQWDKVFLDWLLDRVSGVISRIKENPGAYNEHVKNSLPYQKRTGKILRKNYWDIFPEEKEHFEQNLPLSSISVLEKIVKHSDGGRPLQDLKSMTSGNFFSYCELGYDANSYFSGEDQDLSPKEKYLRMADGRDCGLRNVEENSEEAFIQWFEHERSCGGHPWEIFRGGNSTHISFYINRTEAGWQLTLAGSSRARVVETVKMACALYQSDIPFILRESREILRMVTGEDFIGIVPETILPRYCHSHFPKEDQIIDFMNLDRENIDLIIKKAIWYPERELR